MWVGTPYGLLPSPASDRILLILSSSDTVSLWHFEA
jgi:hypothetical protein